MYYTNDIPSPLAAGVPPSGGHLVAKVPSSWVVKRAANAQQRNNQLARSPKSCLPFILGSSPISRVTLCWTTANHLDHVV
jgi:hypothetical protein